MNGLNDMNEYKSEWMAHAHLLLPVLITRMDQDNNPRYEQAKHNVSSLGRLRLATRATTKAAAVGLALSAIDGPLPIMDVTGGNGPVGEADDVHDGKGSIDGGESKANGSGLGSRTCSESEATKR